MYKIDLEGKDEFTYAKVAHGYHMKIHKKDSTKNDFINEWEFVRILAIHNIHSKESASKRLLRRFNHIPLFNKLYSALS